MKYPEITVKLSGTDGNAFAILGKVQNALRIANVPASEIKEFMKEATSKDYDHLVQTAMAYVNVV